MKLFTLIVCAFLELSVSIPVENASYNNSNVSQFKKIFPKSALMLDKEKLGNQSSEVIKHREINSVAAGTSQYFLLSDRYGKMVIIDAVSYEEVISYDLPEIALSIITVVDDTFYKIDTVKGTILSTAVGNIMEGPSSINWVHVGSFPNESTYIQSSSAVDGSLIYFVTFDGNLYSYDTVSRLVTKIGNVAKWDGYASLIVVNKILYIHKYVSLYSFDGSTVIELATPENRFYAGLFRMGSNICMVGGNDTEVYPDPVYCYNPQDKEWKTPNHINEARRFPAVAATESKTYIFGGYTEFLSSSVTDFWRISIEVLNHETNIWSFAPTPLTPGQEYIQAVAFYF